MNHTIALLTNDKLEIGGVETHIISIAQLINKHKFQLIIIAPTSENFKNIISMLGANSVQWGKTSVLSVLRLVNILKTYEISLLHIHSPTMAILGRIAAYFVGIPVIITMHLSPKEYFNSGTGLINPIKYAIYFLLDFCLDKFAAKKVIYVSKNAQKHALQNGRTHSFDSIAIPNGVGVSFFQSKRQKKLTPNPVIGYWGRIESQKGLDILINSIKLLEKRNKSFELWIVGSGSKKASIKKLICQLDLGTHIKLFDIDKNILELTCEIDIFVLPSRFEAMSISLLEAMASGLPCIVTDVGENASLITNGVHGFVIPIENAEALTNAIEKTALQPIAQNQNGNCSQEKSKEIYRSCYG
jgi:glycosyltransferase involved in cell wall biosynthesis